MKKFLSLVIVCLGCSFVAIAINDTSLPKEVGTESLINIYNTPQDTIIDIDDKSVIYPKTRISQGGDIYTNTGITFDIENLEKDTELFEEKPLNVILENLVKTEYGASRYDIEEGLAIDCRIRGYYNGSDSLLVMGSNRAFFKTIHLAYAHHRPLVISPDMVWLLILQGFANHVNFNPEEMRSFFVDFEGKRKLKTESTIEDNLSWEDIFATFPKEIGKYTGDGLMEVLTADFSTTTDLSRTVSQITIMGAFQDYFEYEHSISVCGIPTVTLEGTTQDWQEVLAKAQSLKKYKMEWWIKELEPVLKKIIESSEGNVDKAFWKKIFKIRELMICGEPDIIDGWIVKFFPYYSTGKKCNLKTLEVNANLASEIHCVDFNYTQINGADSITVPLEIWAGFTGIKQDRQTMALKPEIGWLVRRKNNVNAVLEYYFREASDGFIRFKTDIIPKEFLNLKRINMASISFVNKINIPDEIAKMKINELYLYGKISKKEIRRVCELLPNTKLNINRVSYN